MSVIGKSRSDLLADALGRVTGLNGQVTIDACNLYGERDTTFPSLSHQIKSIIGGPTAKSFSTNFAAAYGRIAAQRVTPSNLFAAEEGARAVTEQLIRDAGYEPLYVGDLDPGARLLEDSSTLTRAIAGQIGPFFYRYAGRRPTLRDSRHRGRHLLRVRPTCRPRLREVASPTPRPETEHSPTTRKARMQMPTSEILTDVPLAGRLAVVTGASSGIGAAIAERLARLGAKVAVLARRRIGSTRSYSGSRPPAAPPSPCPSTSPTGPPSRTPPTGSPSSWAPSTWRSTTPESS